MSKTLLWLDDIRNPNTENWLDYSPIEKPFETVWVKNYNEFVDWIEQNGLPTAICFDHDLEPDIMNGDPMKPLECTIEYAKTGFDCAKWLVNYCIDNNKPLPKYNIQSANPVGGDNINGLLTNFSKQR